MTIEQDFLNAAKTGDQETFIRILNDQSIKIDPNHADEEGNTALILAAHEGHAAIVDMLLTDSSVGPGHANGNGNTALILAAGNGHGDADAHVDPNYTNEDGDTALICAACWGHINIVRTLLADERIDPNHNEQCNTALILAAREGHIDIVRTLLADERIDPNHNKYGNAALIEAAENDHSDIVRALLADTRIDPNHADHYGNTALIWAAHRWAALEGHSDIVRALLDDSRVDRNHTNENGNTALIIAARYGHSNIVCALIDDPRIDLSCADQAKKAIIAATKNEHDKALRLLLEFSGQRLSDDEIANLTGSDRGFYKRILTRLLWRTRFRGIVRLMIYFRRMRLRAAEAVYAPGGTGFDAAAERFSTAVASHQLSSTSTLTSTETNDITVGITEATDEPSEPATKKQRT